MNHTIILSGTAAAWKVTGGSADLYAARLSGSDDGSTDRLYHFKELDEGTVFTDIQPAGAPGLPWVCVVKCSFGAALTAVDAADAADAEDFNPAFLEFTEQLEETVLFEGLLYPIKKLGADEMMTAAVDTLAHVNRKLTRITEERSPYESEAVKVTRVLCDYLKIPLKLPTREFIADSSLLIDEILSLSGVRYKNSLLGNHWWKQENGVFLAVYNQDTPVVMLPYAGPGYLMYEPASHKTIHVNADIAARIQPEIKTAYRTLPARRLKLSDIAAFIAGEHIRKETALILCFSLLAAMVQLLPPILSAQIFDSVIPGGRYLLLFELVFIILAFETANIGFSILINLGLTRINLKWDLALQAAIWDRLLNLKITFFHRYTTGELLEKIKGLNTVINTLSPDFMKRSLTALFSLVNIYILFRYIPDIAPFVLLLFVAVLLVSAAVWRIKYQLKQRLVALSGRIMSINHQIVGSMERIKISAAEERIFGMWSSLEAESRYLQGRIKVLEHALNAFYRFYQLAATAIVYLLIFLKGGTGIGSFVAFISAYLVLQSALLGLLRSLNVLPDLIPVIKDFSPILQSEPEYANEKSVPKELDGSLELNHVFFQYRQYGTAILHDISFRVSPGETLGIVGASGSGKSTLLKLLFGLYEPSGGKIYISGNDLESIDLRYLRQHMSIVLQDGQLTVGSIRSNIIDNSPSVTEDDVRYALKIACLEADIAALPQGLDTPLDNHHHLFSQDQKQKLLIARAVAQKKPYFLLDEATSSLDAITQAKIMHNIRDIPATKIIIAQRLSTLEYCDRILELANGRLV